MFPQSAVDKTAMNARAQQKFRLYVAGSAKNSLQAIANLKALCVQHLPGRHEIETVDVFKHPERALEDLVFMTPMLVRLGPAPRTRVIGTLADTHTVLNALGLETAAT